MEVVGKFNAISKELAESIPVFDKPVIYELVGGEWDPATKRFLFGSAQTLPGRDRIKDGKNIVEIGIPRIKDGDKVKKCEKFFLNASEGNVDSMVAPRIELHPDNVDHVMWHWFWSICNYNASNPNRDKTAKIRIKQVDFEAEAKEKTNKRSTLRDALVTAEDMKAEDVRLFAASKNWDAKAPLGVLVDMVGAFAQQYPAEFLKQVDDPHIKAKAELKLALDGGALRHEISNNSIVWGESGRLLANLPTDPEKTVLDLLHEHLMATKNGDEIMEGIRKRVSSNIKNELKEQNAKSKENTAKGKGGSKNKESEATTPVVDPPKE